MTEYIVTYLTPGSDVKETVRIYGRNQKNAARRLRRLGYTAEVLKVQRIKFKQ